jgi:hypothetical protein
MVTSSSGVRGIRPATRSPPPHLAPEHVGEARGQRLQLLETVAPTVAVAVLPDQRRLVLAHMPVTAFDAGIEGFEVAVQGRSSGLGVIERTGGLGVIAHRQTPGLLLLECTIGPTMFAPLRRRQWPKASIWMTGLAAAQG